MNRGKFIKNTSLATAAIVLVQTNNFPQTKTKNKLPRWKGFNLTDFNTPNPSSNRRSTTEDHLKWMNDWGFDFIRLPIAYPYYLNSIEQKKLLRKKFTRLMNQQLIKLISWFSWRINTIYMFA